MLKSPISDKSRNTTAYLRPSENTILIDPFSCDGQKNQENFWSKFLRLILKIGIEQISSKFLGSIKKIGKYFRQNFWGRFIKSGKNRFRQNFWGSML
jgi:hypothetical protein